MALRAVMASLAAVPALALGVVVARGAGVGLGALAPSLVGLAVGLVLVAVLARYGARDAIARGLPWVAVAVVAATFLGPDAQGVHRWIPVGPLQLNASEAALPWVLFGLARRRGEGLAAIVALQALHVAQPDAAQATVLAALAALLLPGRGRAATATAALVALLAALAWLRPDEVAPVPHVEGILALAADQGAIWLALAGLAGAATLAAVVVLGRSAPRRAAPGLRSRAEPASAGAAGPGRGAAGAGGEAAGSPAPGSASKLGDARFGRYVLAIPVWFGASLVAALVGAFPVPLYGVGAAPILGWCGVVAWASIAADAEAPGRDPPG